MKKFFMLIVFLLVMVAMMSPMTEAQVDILGIKSYGISGMGSSFSAGSKPVAINFYGLNTSLYTADGWKFYVRTLYNEVNSEKENEYQGGSVWEMNQKSLGLFGGFLDWYAAFGLGAFDDPEESIRFAVKLETGVDVYKKFGLALGIDYMSIDEKSDRMLVYCSADYFP